MNLKKQLRHSAFKATLFSVFLACSSKGFAIEPVSVSASGDDGNVPTNTLDDNLSTRWSDNGNGVWVQYDLGNSTPIQAVELAFYKGDQRSASFQIQSSEDANTWTTLVDTSSSGATLALESYELNAIGQYFRILGFGNTSNSWTSVTEVNFVEGGPQPTPTPTPTPTPSPTPTPEPGDDWPIISASASSNDGNGPANVFDGSLSTRWSANGDGEYITLDLGSTRAVGALNIAWYQGSSRTADFEIYIGDDPNNLYFATAGTSSGTTTSLEHVEFIDQQGRYVRIVGYGNSSNSWNSITEVEVLRGEEGPGTPVSVIQYSPDTPRVGTPVQFDGSGSYNSTGGPLTFDWDLGDGTSSSAVSPTHSYSLSGTYSVTLTVTNAAGTSVSSDEAVTVMDIPSDSPIADIDGPANARVNTYVSFNAGASFDPDGGDLSAYYWDFGDGQQATTESPSVTHRYTSTGNYTVGLTVVDDESYVSDEATHAIAIDDAPIEQPWPLWNHSFEESSSFGGWYEEDPSNVVSTNGTSNPMPTDGGRLLVIKGDGGRMKQAIYKPVAGNRYRATARVYGHGTIGIDDIGSDSIYETTVNHGENWQVVTVEYISTGSPAFIYARYGNGSGDAYFDEFEVANVTTAADLEVPAPQPIMRYASQVIDLSLWKITLPINGAEEHYTPELYTFESDEWFKLVYDEDEQAYAAQFRANHGGATTGGSSNPRSELRELTENYHYRNSKSAAAWSNTDGKKHTMWIKQKVTNLTYVKPHVVVGQIHDSGDDVVVFRMEGHKGVGGDWDNSGTVGDPDTHANLWITNGNDRHGYLVDDNYELGTVFTVKFESYDGKTEFWYNGEKLPYVHYEEISGCYFKLGNYTQSHNGTAPGETDEAFAQTWVYDYYVTHE